MEYNLKGQVQITFMSLLIWNDSIDFNDITDWMYEFSCAFFYFFQQ